MNAKVHIVDYGLGNLYSVARAVEACGGEPALVSSAKDIAKADRLVLPGVGAFENGMQGLVVNGLDDAICEFARTGRPLMGICLGMQMLATQSVEFGAHAGLGLIPGQVTPIPRVTSSGNPRKVPFVGWAKLNVANSEMAAQSPLASLRADDYVYLVHSYQFVPTGQDDLLATYEYEGVAIAAAVVRDNVLGCQFHPEKSSAPGLKVVRAFLDR